RQIARILGLQHGKAVVRKLRMDGERHRIAQAPRIDLEYRVWSVGVQRREDAARRRRERPHCSERMGALAGRARFRFGRRGGAAVGRGADIDKQAPIFVENERLERMKIACELCSVGKPWLKARQALNNDLNGFLRLGGKRVKAKYLVGGARVD